MDEQRNWVFNTPKSYKKGRYIFSRWKPTDFMIMSICMIIALVSLLIFVINKWLGIISGMVIISIFVVPLILFWPIDNYFNVITLIKTKIKFNVKRKEWIWNGVVYEEE